MTLSVGFTGTRHGMSPYQKAEVRRVLQELLDHRDWFNIGIRFQGQVRFRHGLCKGSDVQAAAIAHDIGYITVGHPGPNDDEWRDTGWKDDELDTPHSHFARNREIVNRSAIIIATPFGDDPAAGGGTWYTVQYARKLQAKTGSLPIIHLITRETP